MLALIFAVVGVVIFIVLYIRNVEGNLFSALTDPFIVMIVLIPFLPAAVLSFLAGRLDREYARKYLQK